MPSSCPAAEDRLPARAPSEPSARRRERHGAAGSRRLRIDLTQQSAQAYSTGSVFREKTRAQGSTQTPPQAEQQGTTLRNASPHQKHWEGWKIHVSVPDSVAGDIVSRLIPQLEGDQAWYKFRKKIDEYRKVSDDSVGKFIVIYPRSIAHLPSRDRLSRAARRSARVAGR